MVAELRRRAFLARGLGAAAGLTAARGLGLPRAAAAATTGGGPATIALPTGAQVRRDIQRMVDLGARYTGTAAHATGSRRSSSPPAA